MPQVPRYDQVADRRALPTARLRGGVDPDVFGAGVGGALARVGGAIVQEEQRKADEIILMSARRRVNEKSNAVLIEASNKKGSDAFGLPDTVLPDFDKFSDEVTKGLNDRQRHAFQPIIEHARNSIDLAVQRHVAQERQQFDTNETLAYQKTEQDAAVFYYKDPIRVAASIANQIDAIKKFAARNGLGPDWVKQQVTDAQSQTHLLVLERAVASGDDQYAKAYYDEVKGDIVGDKESARAAKLVQDSTYQGESQRVADKILQEHKLDRRGAQAAVEAIKDDPKLRDLVQTRVDQAYTRRELIERDDREELFKYATRLVLTGQPVTPDVLGSLTLDQAKAIRQYENQVAKGIEPSTDWEVWYRLMGKASSDDKKQFQKFLDEDLMRHRPVLADAEFKQMVALQKSLRQRGAVADDKLTGYRTIKQIVDDSLNAAGIDPTPRDGSDDAGSVAQFRRMVDNLVLDHQVTHGRKPNTVEVQSMVDGLLIRGKVPGTGWVWNAKKRAFELDVRKGEQLVVNIGDVPVAWRMRAEEALKRHGKPVTDDEVVRLYGQYIQLQLHRATR